MKIALITEEYLPIRTGVSINLHKKLSLLSELGYEVRIYSPDCSLLSKQYPDYKKYSGEIMPGIKVITFPSQSSTFGKEAGNFTLDPQFNAIQSINPDILEFNPDLIHVDSPERLAFSAFNIPGLKAAKKLKIPICGFYRSHLVLYIDDYKKWIWYCNIPGLAWFMKKFVAWVYNKYDLTLVSSLSTENLLKEWGVKQTHLGNFLGIELNKFYPDEKIRKNKVSGDFKILYLGRLDPDKNINQLLTVFDKAAKKIPNSSITIVGHGTLQNEVSKWCKDRENVTYAGSIPNEETIKYYNNADLFVTTSNRETFGTTLIEAMACGLPAVGPDKNGTGDRIKHNKTGLLVPDGDIEAYVAAIYKLYSDKELRKKMFYCCLDVVKRLENSKTIKNMINVWETLLNKS